MNPKVLYPKKATKNLKNLPSFFDFTKSLQMKLKFKFQIFWPTQVI